MQMKHDMWIYALEVNYASNIGRVLYSEFRKDITISGAKRVLKSWEKKYHASDNMNFEGHFDYSKDAFEKYIKGEFFLLSNSMKIFLKIPVNKTKKRSIMIP